ncbi:MAG: spore coat protein [Oscillospiraceae bacterium]|nr:spore coat protein [Oscillospiraceae bacterium]
MAAVTQGTMGDREMVTDLLSTQKFMAASYNTYAGECKCPEMRNSLLDILRQQHQMQSELFTTMESRGWYPVKEAPINEISTVRQKFC